MDPESIGSTGGSGDTDFSDSGSPDVAMDGSIKTGEEPDTENDGTGNSSGFLGKIRTALQSLF